ncbi:MAG: helix-turn-helix transcriptional regulator [Eikenella corrodens]|uniref:helix-turn-helix domain-containing protein n=1 Tax=Eikenella corrodens TaxID=539 RepID=UPI00205D8FDB|nr:helix-turn-helix transcriptional regulator [Eikenella corrodens]MDU4299968.1 helix-turn-helix transcriptional regulator [Eikenella corrodens]DAT21537.1 MAG TPA: Regulatory protein [Caudoviricetes sp.]
MKLTAFGKVIRQIRLDRLIRLKEMADGIGVTSAFLSAVESGAKEIPDGFAQKIIDYLKLDSEQANKLLQAVDETKKTVTIQMPESSEDRYLIGAFARNLNTLDNSRKERILKLLRGEDE